MFFGCIHWPKLHTGIVMYYEWLRIYMKLSPPGHGNFLPHLFEIRAPNHPLVCWLFRSCGIWDPSWGTYSLVTVGAPLSQNLNLWPYILSQFLQMQPGLLPFHKYRNAFSPPSRDEKESWSQVWTFSRGWSHDGCWLFRGFHRSWSVRIQGTQMLVGDPI